MGGRRNVSTWTSESETHRCTRTQDESSDMEKRKIEETEKPTH
jgi:hypothetical protein